MASSEKDRPRVMLLDGHSLAYRAFYALPVENFSTVDGQPTNAVYGFTSMLINLLRDETPTRIAACFDVSRVTFRTERFPEYKATRTAAPDGFKGQVELIIQVLAALRIPVLREEGFEADDLIATLATRASAEGDEVLIVTGDRDALQLVDDNVTVLYPRKGVSDLTRFTPAAVEEKYGLTPVQYPDFAALRGDPSDNLPNMPGVGEKTAAKWVRDYGSLEALLAQAGQVKGKAGETLRAHADQVRLNRQLTELVREAPVELAPADLEWRSWDADAVYQLFDALEFKVLRDRLLQTLGDRSDGGAVAAAPAVQLGMRVLTAGELAPWLTEHVTADVRIGLALAGRWGRGTGEVTGIALCTGANAAYVDPVALDEADERAFAAWLAADDRPKVLHDAKGQSLALAARGLTLRGVVCDTALAAYLVLPGQRTFDLPDLVMRILHRELEADGDDNGQLSLDAEADEQAAAHRLMRAAQAVLELADTLESELSAKGGLDLLRDVELPLVDVLAAMERTGIAVDGERLSALEAEFAGDVKHAVEEAHASVGRQFNLGSPKQLQEILFGELNLPKTKRIKTGYTTDAEALAQLAAHTEHPLPVILLRHRDVARLRVTVEGLIKSVADDGRIHTTFAQMVAATGRLSSVDPNLQNIPIRTAAGRQIRGAFVAGEGFESLLTADYSQIEMRIMADLSGDEGLIEAFTTGEDLHTTVASRVFDVPAGSVEPEMRRRIKAMSYGLAYGLSSYGLSQQLGITAAEAQGLMDEYFERFGGVRDYLRDVVEHARHTGYTETILGRRRYLPDLTSDNRQRREMAERMALNAPIQGSAADIIKVAMLRVDLALRDAGLASRMLLQVHDELVFEVAPGERDTLATLVRDEMGAAYRLRVPLDVSIGSGPTWHDAGH